MGGFMRQLSYNKTVISIAKQANGEQVMTTQLNKARTYTVEEFMSLPDDGKRYELIEGELKEMPGRNINHGRITTRLVVSIANYLAGAGKESGEVFTNMAFELAPKTAPVPDVAFITA
jgi:Uma2 family endonuclease